MYIDIHVVGLSLSFLAYSLCSKMQSPRPTKAHSCQELLFIKCFLLGLHNYTSQCGYIYGNKCKF